MMRRQTLRDRLAGCLVLTGLVLTLASSGCASGGTESPFEGQGDPGQVLLLRVENRNFHEITIFLRNVNRRQEIGSVVSRGVEFLNLPWDPGRPLNLELESSVGERYRLTPHIYGGSGRLELIIAPELRDSVLRG